MLDLVIAIAVAYLGWRLWKGPKRRPSRTHAPAPRASGEADALAVLGLDERASNEDIRSAHRRLIAAVHPDRGGSADLARRINAARDVLLKQAPD
ncbi:J domain-containing protein [Sphingomonas koreensis]|nr:J domain-containing protein [Sphingomonas koreensis]